jgi:hypothetical protein
VNASAPVVPDPSDPVDATPLEVPVAPPEPAEEGLADPPVAVVVVVALPLAVVVEVDPFGAVVLVDVEVVVVGEVVPDDALHAHSKPSGSVVVGTEVNVMSTSQ